MILGNIWKSKKGIEILETIIMIAVLGSVVIVAITGFSSSIKKGNEGLTNSMQNSPIILNK